MGWELKGIWIEHPLLPLQILGSNPFCPNNYKKLWKFSRWLSLYSQSLTNLFGDIFYRKTQSQEVQNNCPNESIVPWLFSLWWMSQSISKSKMLHQMSKTMQVKNCEDDSILLQFQWSQMMANDVKYFAGCKSILKEIIFRYHSLS